MRADSVQSNCCRAHRLAMGIVALACILATNALAQVETLEHHVMSVDVADVSVAAPLRGRSAVHGTIVQVPGAAWVRLDLSSIRLGTAGVDGAPTVLRLTSLQDGAVQLLDANNLEQWRGTSAYFNGGIVAVDVIADAGAASSLIDMERVWYGETTNAGGGSICGSTDNRWLSDDPRVGRIGPVGCTAWLIDDAQRCFLSAGHCALSLGNDVVQFNVPLSTGSGQWNHPPPSDQYIIDQSSLQTNQGQGIGNDWAYFGCYPNSTTGLTPAQAQGAWFERAATAVPETPAGITITGFGTTALPAPLTWNQVQKTHDGALLSSSGTTLKYDADTTGGNSGSPVIDIATGQAIGIHTHGGCNSLGGNFGTSVDHPSVIAAIANPLGVCAGVVPTNDSCATRLDIGLGTIPFTTIGAATGPLDATCGDFTHDIWFDIHAPTRGRLFIDVTKSTFPVAAAVYDTTCPVAADDAVLCVALDDATAEELTLETDGDGRFALRVGGLSNGQGVGVLDIAFVPACPGDCSPVRADGSYGNGVVNLDDVITMLTNWGSDFAPGDIQPAEENSIGNGVINVDDLIELLLQFGPCDDA
ncbi:MAG: hypothetical protein AAF432_06345 [Planctomycetota bacterium]